MSLRPLSVSSNGVQIVNAINGMLQGRSNAVGEVTLTASASSTVVGDVRISADSAVLLMPRTATAAAAVVYQGATINGQVTLQHDVNAATDRSFFYVICG